LVDTRDISTISFYFRADDRPGEARYDYTPKRLIFQTIYDLDVTSALSFWVYSGDLLLSNLAYVPSQAEVDPNRRSKSVSYVADTDLYVSIMWDYSDSLAEGWCTLPVDIEPLALAAGNVYVLACSDLSLAHASAVDDRLRQADDLYLGAAHIDMGNPIQASSIALPRYFFYADRALYYLTNPGDEPLESLENAGYWWHGTSLTAHVVPADYENYPRLPVPREASERGRVSERLLKCRRPTSHFARVALALDLNTTTSGGGAEAKTTIAKSPEQPVVPREKLVHYCLNLDDSESAGYSKAILFRDVLGITSSDWRYLADQLSRGLATGEVHNVRATQYGVKYHVDIPVLGLNGVHRNVRSAWILIGDAAPRLVTAYIPNKEVGMRISQESVDSYVVADDGGSEEEWWERVFDRAAAAALEASGNVIPTPMFIKGYQPVLDGPCGGARVMVPDARRRFSRWLIRTGRGERSLYRGGVAIWARTNSQSYERAVAYAQTMADVFKANGISCEVSSYLD